MSLAVYRNKPIISSLAKSIPFSKPIAVSKALTEKINIFLTVSQHNIDEHFNPNDPSPIYKRQLSHQFEQYILTSIESAKRYSVFSYKINCKNADDKQYTEPLIYAIKRHFSAKKMLRIGAFERFKRRTYILLFASLAVVMICHGLVPLILKEEGGLHSALRNGLDIFSWVILWQPIDKLVFHWNPFLKDISIMDRLANAEVIITENA